ncbi:MAG: serine/threonine protein kinase, partial [Acaryochloridaceae cyanobacterium CSU_5_19]|nr:serine/threonine protein kinase [Acaryochloridaceae cyanobacterium CSU_5_19]
ASDVYSLGVTCIYLLTGKSPKDLSYSPSTGELSWQEHVKVGPHLREILSKMLEISLRDRYRSAKEVSQALAQQTQSAPALHPARTNSPARASTHQPVSSPSRPVSPSARAASRIREYNTRLGTQSPLTESFSKVSGPLNSSSARGIRSPYGKDSSSSLSSKGRGAAKLTPNAIQHAFAQGQRDFSNQDLRNLDLRRVQLPNANFHESRLQNIDLRDAILLNSNFGRVNFTGANLRNANLMQAYLSHADLSNTDLRGANLSEAYLSHANLRGANLCGADLTGAKVTDAQLSVAQTNWLTVLPNGKRGRKGRC